MTDLEGAVERELARLSASEKACEGEMASWADRARAHDKDRRTILDALASITRERDEARELLSDAEADLATLISKFSYFDDGEPKDWSEWQSARATLARIRAAALVNGEGE